MKVDFTLKRFPINGRLKEQSGLPFSCVLQPFHRLPEKDAAGGEAAAVPRSSSIARCAQCYSYINCYCVFDTAGWVCSLCNRHNALKPQQLKRYRLDPAVLQALPEVRAEVFETLAEDPIPVPLPPPEGSPAAQHDPGSVSGPAPVVVALVDTAAGEEFLELVRSSLEAALEALPPVTRFALITMSNRLGLHDVRAAEPTVRYVSMLEPQLRPGASAASAALSSPAVVAPLSDVMPLSSLLAPVGGFKGAITRALEEQMVPEQGFGDAAEASTDAAGAATGGATTAGAPGQESGMSRLGGGGAPGGGAAAGGGPRGQPLAARGLGPALVAVLDYLKVLQSPPFVSVHAPTSGGGSGATSAAVAGADHLSQNPSPVKLLLFLAGVPDFGVGRLVNPRRRRNAAAAAAAAVAAVAAASGDGAAGPAPAAPDPDAWLEDVPSSSIDFYEQAAAACASLGVCVDLFSVSHAAIGLKFLAPLCSNTGGAIYLYPSVDESAMPQDVYLRLSAASASAGILRLRTTPHFKHVRHYGRLFPDPTIPDLHHIIAADPSDAFAVDFDFASPSGFAGVATSLPPTLQIAFQYTTLVCEKPQQLPPGDAANGNGGAAPGNGGAAPANGGSPDGVAPAAGAGRGYWLQRRLRVATYRVNVAATVADVYAHTNPDAVVTLLMHKVMRVAETQGVQEARLLLRDWLVILALCYHRNVHANLSLQQLATVPADLHFSQAPHLAPLPRLVYALLRSPLLAPFAEGQHPDLTAFLRHLWSGLPPSELVRAVYPVMQSYTNPEQLAYPRHSLSRTALAGPDAPPIFLLDAYILIMVYYTSRCPPEVPFPPPQQSALRKAVAAIRSERRITPQVKILREGGEDSELFEQLLLDEPDGHDAPAGGSGGGGFGLVQFLDHVGSEAALQLQHDAQQAAAAAAQR